uniref:Uncharacterized protein n=1 Tax=Amphimedon queenslandica TaxID=400682 RepID=A0A1X7TB90_AMPQE
DTIDENGEYELRQTSTVVERRDEQPQNVRNNKELTLWHKPIIHRVLGLYCH